MPNTLQDLMTIFFTGKHHMIKVSPDEREAAIVTLFQFLLLGDSSGKWAGAIIDLKLLDDATKDLIMSVIIEAKL